MPDANVQFVLSAKDLASGKVREFKGELQGLGKAGQLARRAVEGGLGFGVGLGAVQVAGAAIHKTVAYIGDSIKAASDLSETQNKVAVVFGSSADAVLKFGETSATAVGQSKNDALAAAGTYGNLFRAIGLTEGASAKMSVKMVQLAGDLASFNNADPKEVLEALRAGLVGEAEPLRKFGINITDARLRAEAFAMGISDGKSVLNASAKAQASYSLILKDSTLAQGDYARTSTGLANTQRSLSAQMADLSAKLGAGLLPLFTRGVQLASMFASGLDDLFTSAGRAGDQLNQALDSSGFEGAVASIIVGAVKVGQLVPQAFDHVGKSIHQATTTGAEDAAVNFRKMAIGSALEFDRVKAAARVGMTGAALETQTKAKQMAAQLQVEIQAKIPAITTAAMNLGVAMAGGLLSAIPNIHASMTQLYNAINDGFTNEGRIAYDHSKGVATTISRGLKDSTPEIRVAARENMLAIAAELDKLEGFGAGQRFMRQFGYGITSGAADARAAALGAARGIRGVFPTSEPKDPQSPFRGWTQVDPLKIVVDNMRRTAASAGNVLNGALGGMSLAPAMLGGRGASYASGGGSGGAVNVTVHVNAPLGTPAAGQAVARELIPELVREMRRQRVLR